MNIGIVLSGGMAKGAYQFGALKAISEIIPNEYICCMSCASVGVLNGYTFAVDHLERGERVWCEFCSENEKIKITDVLRSEKLQNDIRYLYDKNGEMNCDLYCTLFDADDKKIVYKNLKGVPGEQLYRYLKASVSMPVYNRSVEIDHVHYYDGAMIDNIPVYPLLSQKLDYIICVYFDETCYKFESNEFDSKIIKLTFPAESRIRQSVIFERQGLLSMLDLGYDRSCSTLNDIFKNGFDDKEYVYKKISEYDKEKKASLRITGDVLVTNINKVAAKITGKRTIIE